MKVLPPYLLVLLLLAGCLAFSGCARHAERTPVAPPPAHTRKTAAQHSVGRFTNYQLTFPENGPRIWVARMRSGSMDEKTGDFTLTGVTCQLYRAGKRTLNVSADQGRAHLLQGKTADIHLTGHVHAVETVRGLQLDADAFHWISDDGHITAERVHWLGVGLDHRANHGIFTTDLTHGTFTGDVQTSTDGL